MYNKNHNKLTPIYGIENVIIDVCRVVEGKYYSVIGHMIFSDLKKFTNMIHTCPYKVSKTLFLRYYQDILEFIYLFHSLKYKHRF